jgi:hypothetical protein
MGSLTTCLKRTRAGLAPGDEDAIVNAAADLRDTGLKASEAAQKAVRDLLAQAIAARNELKPAPEPVAAPAAPRNASMNVGDKKYPATVMGSRLLAIVNKAGGLSPSLISEFSERVTTTKIDKKTGKLRMIWRNPMVPQGNLFRAGGTSDYSRLGELMEENGYLPPGSAAADYKAAGEAAKDMIKAALISRKDAPTQDDVIAEAQASQDAERDAYYAELEAEAAREAEAEREAIIAEASAPVARIDDMADDDVPWDLADNHATRQQTADFLGITVEELNREQGLQGPLRQDEQAQAGSGEGNRADAGGAADQTAEAGSAAARDRPAEEGLTLEAQTPEDLRAKAEREQAAADRERKQRTVEQERLRKEAEGRDLKARADQTLDSFELGQSADQQMSGMGDMFADAPAAPSKNTIFTEDAAEKARALLRRKLGQINTGIDPEVMQAGITLAGYHIEKGARKFADFARAMLDDMGELVRPYLKSWYLAAKFDPRTSGMDGLSSAAEVDRLPADPVPKRRKTGPVLSQSTRSPKGVPAADLRRMVDALSASWKGLRARPEVVATAADLPQNIVDALRSMNALGTTRGLRMPDGKVYLIANKLDSMKESQAVLFHEVLGHEGLRAFLGDSYLNMMGALRMANPALAAEANTWYARFGQDQITARVEAGMSPAEAGALVRALAVEEALADRAGEGVVPKAWKSVMAALQRALRRIKGMEWIADWLEKKTEAETYAVLMGARRAIERGTGDLVERLIGVASPTLQRVWHGTPHNVDKFDTGKIGTGEGTQAYGWGLYFASKKEIAEHYRKTLSGGGAFPETINDDDHPRFMAILRSSEKATKALYEQFAKHGADTKAIADGLERQALLGVLLKAADKQAMRDFAQMVRGGLIGARSRGNLYEVEIPEDDEMLLWDKPRSEQPPKVQKALSGLEASGALDAEELAWFKANPNAVGRALYGHLTTSDNNPTGGGQRGASEALAALGIRGIKYLDGVSRNKPLRDVKREFLAELPEDADFNEVMDLIGDGTFSQKNEDVLRALADNDWLGFDYPAQAISAALSSQLSNFDPSPELVRAVAATQDDSTYNYVIFSGDDVEIQQALLSRTPTILSDAFKRWFGKSTIANPDGTPKVMYHGTGADIRAFRGQQAGAIFLTDEPIFAQAYANASAKWLNDRGQSGGENILPVYVKAESPFDYDNPKHVDALVDQVFKQAPTYTQGDGDKALVLDGKQTLYTPDVLRYGLTEGKWSLIEMPEIQAAIKAAGHDSFYVNEDDFKNLAVYEPTQVKSAIGNRGTFDPTNADITLSQKPKQDQTQTPEFNDLSRVGERIMQMGYEKQSVPRVQAARKMAGLIKRLEEGKITEAYFTMAVKMLAETMADVSATKSANRLMTERERGPDIVREKLIRARRQGDLDHVSVEFALWAIDQNEALADGLAISIRAPVDDVAAGDYNPTSQIIRIFKGNDNEDIAVHEIMHHAERMMPEDMQDAIRREWSKALGAAIKKATPAQRVALELIPEFMAGSKLAYQGLVQAIQQGPLNYADHYQLVNPSEFWAVNAASLLSRRFVAKDSVWARIKNYLSAMVEKIKGLLGLRSDAPLLKALGYLLDKGNFGIERGGTFESPKMLNDAKATAGALQDINRSSAPFVDIQLDQNGNPTFRGATLKLDYPQPAERFEFIPGPGQQLLNYAIMPVEGFDSLGFVELVVENGQVTALMDIEVNGTGRRAGVGKQVIETILAANPEADVNISNIVHQARGFWAKMGIPEQNLEDGAAYDGTLNWQTYAQAADDGRAAQVGRGMQGQVRRDDARAAQGDRGAGPGGQAPVLSQVGQTPPAQSGWVMPEGSRFDNFTYKFQNKNVDLLRATNAIKAESGAVADHIDAYLQEELFHGRAAKRTQDFVRDELEPLLKDMKRDGISTDQIDKYLHARHAKEANELIAQRNRVPNHGQMGLNGQVITSPLQDGGSGMLTQDAADYLAALDPAARARLEAAAAKIDAIIAKTREYNVAYGLESRDTVDGWAAMFKHYVPLMREDHEGGRGTGQGFSIKGPEAKHRTGSQAKVIDILANIAMARERTIVRGEKNRVAVSLAALVKENPNPDVWEFGPVTERRYNKATDSVEVQIKGNWKSANNVLVAKVRSSKGAVLEVGIVFNERNERAVRMAEALKNLDAAQLEGMVAMSAKLTRWFAAINTQYNPIFGIVNLVRDVQGAALNLSSTEIHGKQLEVTKQIPSALRAIYRDERGKTAKNQAMRDLWEELQREGGMTGFRDLFQDSEHRAKAIRYAMDPTSWTESKLGRFVTAGGALRVPVAMGQTGVTSVFRWLSDYNQAMEGATRLAAYKVALDMGLSKQRAASIAKNLTVNFNRKGQVGQQAGAFYAFFNAAMQGTARMGEVLVDTKNGQGFKITSAGLKIVSGGLLLGSMQAVLLAMAGFDDDEPPQFVRERSVIIPTGWLTGSKDYVSIPMPLGWHVIPNFSRILTEFTLSGFRDPGKRAAQMVGIVADAFNPLGNAGMSWQTVTPTAVGPLPTDIIVALIENQDWTGKPIARRTFNEATPGFKNAKDTASTPAKWAAEKVNALTGGTEYKAGHISPTPDQIDYIIGQAFGGVARELSKFNQTGSALLTGEDLPPHKIPLVGRFYGNADAASSQGNRFYAAVKEMDLHEAQIKGLQRAAGAAKTPAERAEFERELKEYKAENPEADLFFAANVAQRQVQNLRKLKREAMQAEAPRERIKELDAKITEAMRGFNDKVRSRREPDKAPALQQ